MEIQRKEQEVDIEVDENKVEEIKNPEEFAAKIFDRLDINGRGTINPNLLIFHQRSSGQSDSNNLYKELKSIQMMDTDGDSLISKDEFVEVIKYKNSDELFDLMEIANQFSVKPVQEIKVVRVPTEQEIEHARQIFKMIDFDNKGVISPPRLIFHRRSSLGSNSTSLFDELKVFQKFDVNGDSSVSEQEFISVYCDSETSLDMKTFVDSFAQRMRHQPPVPLNKNNHQLKSQSRQSETTTSISTEHDQVNPIGATNVHQNQQDKELARKEQIQVLKLLTRAVSKKIDIPEQSLSQPFSDLISQEIEEVIFDQQEEMPNDSTPDHQAAKTKQIDEIDIGDQITEVNGEIFQESEDIFAHNEGAQTDQEILVETKVIEGNEEVFFQTEVIEGKSETIQPIKQVNGSNVSEGGITMENFNKKFQTIDTTTVNEPVTESQRKVLLQNRINSSELPKDYVGNTQVNKNTCCCFAWCLPKKK